MARVVWVCVSSRGYMLTRRVGHRPRRVYPHVSPRRDVTSAYGVRPGHNTMRSFDAGHVAGLRVTYMHA